MIGKLKGYIDGVYEDYIILDVNGVGYKVYCSNKLINKIQEKTEQISLFIETIVRENAITLFGFENIEEQQCYNILCSVNGVGNKVAIKIMGTLNIDDIIFALCNKDQSVFTRVPGIGPKLASRIITELKDCQLTKNIDVNLINKTSSTDEKVDNALFKDAVNALESLGYQKNIVMNAVKNILKERPDLTLESVITEGLKRM